MTDCLSCGGDVVDAYRLPGGDVVHAADVPFSDVPQGVEAIRVCRSCGDEVGVMDSR
jgi:hypothetical protein